MQGVLSAPLRMINQLNPGECRSGGLPPADACHPRGRRLHAHPDVYEAVVIPVPDIPVPDEKWGEIRKALVVLKPGSQES